MPGVAYIYELGETFQVLTMILSFEDYIIENYGSHEFYNINNGKVEKEDYKIPNNYKIFFKDRGICPSCKIKAILAYSDFDEIGAHMSSSTFVSECPQCGWWQITHESETEFGHSDTSKQTRWNREVLCHSIVKKFDTNDYEIPLSTLLSELTKRKEILYHLHPTKMEELSQCVLKEFFDCEVHHVGKSGDGGKDLILIMNEDKILVQVKRRSKANSVESVATVRDLLGTLFIENSKKGMIISTANHFSKQASKIQNQLIRNGKLEYFELIDFKRFCEMLDIIRKLDSKPWQRMLKLYGWRYGYT